MTITAARREQLREWGRKGGRKRAQMPDFNQHQSNAGKRSAEVNDMVGLGRKGAQAFLRKYGYARLFRLCRNYRLANPSRLERQVMAILDGLGATYEREAEVLGPEAYISVDFYLPDPGKIIEVYGPVHYDPRFDHPNYPNTRRSNDAARRRRLERAGFQVMIIDYRDLTDQIKARYRIIEFLSDF